MTVIGGYDVPEPTRFRAVPAWFVVGRHQDVYAFRVGATAERTVDLVHQLAQHLDPAVDVAMADARTGRRWHGALLALPDVRTELGRLRQTLASYGGVELMVYTGSDQLTLTEAVQLVIYARTDRWSYLLDGLGFTERKVPEVATWRPALAPLHPVPMLETALVTAAERLGLTEVRS